MLKIARESTPNDEYDTHYHCFLENGHFPTLIAFSRLPIFLFFNCSRIQFVHSANIGCSLPIDQPTKIWSFLFCVYSKATNNNIFANIKKKKKTKETIYLQHFECPAAPPFPNPIIIATQFAFFTNFFLRAINSLF